MTLEAILGRSLQLIHQLLNRIRRFPKRGGLIFLQLDFDDLFESVAAEFHRHADEEAVAAILALQERGTRQNLALVFENRLDHLHRRRARRVPRGCLEQVTISAPPVRVRSTIAAMRSAEMSSVIGMP